MADPLACPRADQLRQLLDGGLAEAAQATVTAHLDACPACQQRLEGLATGNSSLYSTPVLSALSRPREPLLDNVLQAFKADTRVTFPSWPTTPAAWVQSFLQPATTPDYMGRFDAYDVMEVVGQGGMGIVLKAFDAPLKRWVAIKVLAPHLAGDSVSRQRFAREAQAVAAVRHEHVVAIHAVHEVNGLPFIVMEFVDGGALDRLVQAHGPLPWQTVAQLGIQIASGLAAAHAQGLIHRDIKPSNVLVSSGAVSGAGMSNESSANTTHHGPHTIHPVPTHHVKITDFGLAQLASEVRLTHSGIVAGTPMYMAPEQALGEAVDARADLFSLGSVLYTLCTGKEPFPGGSPMAVLRHVCETTPPPIREVNSAIPVALAAIVERLQAKDPDDRLASALEVVKALHACLEQPDRATAIALPAVRRRRKSAGWPVRWAILLAVLALFLGLGWVFRTAWLQPNHFTDPRIALRATLTGHEGPVWTAAFAPDGGTVATGSDDGTIRWWDPTDGRQRAVRQAHRGAVYSIQFAHNDKFLASGGGDGILKLWSPAGDREEAAFKHNGGIRRITVAPDDATIAVVRTDQTVELWDVPGGKKRTTLRSPGATIFVASFAPDGRTLATGDLGGVIKLWDPVAGTELASFRGDPLGIRALAFHPDSETLASTGTSDRNVTIWDVASRQPVAVLESPEHVLSLAFAPDGAHLATSSRSGVIRLWDLATRSVIAVFSAHRGTVLALAFSPDGQLLVSAGEDREAKLWDLASLGWPRPAK
ncbi:hypothetical protein AYO44_17845 [Planctomycetaceae bacterium SCGC AG-212-F19]|nr:hypothetical protein AYO44_17845 [Planctomycetaceae bacterium SCGC AG-212-F19]